MEKEVNQVLNLMNSPFMFFCGWKRIEIDNPRQLWIHILKVNQMYLSDPCKVTKGKSALEKALKLAKKLKKETTMVKDFLESVNQDLDSKEATPGVHNLDQDLSYVKVLQGFNSHIYGR